MTYGLFFLLLGSACTDVQEEMEINKPDKEGKTVSLTVTSRPLQASGTATRSEGKGMDVILGDGGEAATRAVAEDKIANICVFQFAGSKEAAGAVLKAKTYLEDLVDGPVEINLVPSNGDCFLYVCANVGDITNDFAVDSSTFQNLMDASYAVQNKQASFSSLLPMSGSSNAFNTSTLVDNIAITLTRMVAKVTFVCDLSVLPTGATFNIADAKLRNVPKSMKYYLSAAANNNTEVDTYIGTKTENTSAKTTTYTWYMPENKGRTPQNTVAAWTDRYAKNTPLYATYIELTGNYTASGGSTYEVTYVVYLGNGIDINNYDVERNHHYTVTSKIKGINTADKRVTIDTDLSADGLANCYLAGKDNHWYRFNGTVRGNGNSEDYAQATYNLQMIPDGGVNITGITKAFVVWETADGLIQEVKWDATSGCVKFQTGTAKGNALIAVANDSEVLWSWHIWRTDNVDLAALNERYTLNIETNTDREWYTKLTDVGAGKGHKRSLVLMDRNLGSAFNGKDVNIEDCKGAYCLHYQFGRKDPFPAGTAYSATSGQVNGDVSLYGNKPRESYPFTILSKAKEAPKGGNAMSTILNTIKEPERFYFLNAEPYNWISGATVSSNDWKISNCLWGDENKIGGGVNGGYMDPEPWDGKKTIYDPSPAGWRVAPVDVWTGIANTTITSWISIGIANIYRSNNWSSSAPWGHEVYFNNNTGVTTFLPASGCRDAGDGALYHAGAGGYGWLSSPGGQGSRDGSSLGFSSSTLNVAYEHYRADGFPVRCVRD